MPDYDIRVKTPVKNVTGEVPTLPSKTDVTNSSDDVSSAGAQPHA